MPRWDVNFNTHLDDRHSEIVSGVAMAHAFAGVIRDIPIPPHVKDRLDALNILRAVRGTTGIEGIELTEDEVKQTFCVGTALFGVPHPLLALSLLFQ